MLLDAGTSCLLIVDIQERLAPAIAGIDAVVERVSILMRAADRLAVPMLLSEQYPKGLGPTIAPIAALAPFGATVEKIEFSAAANPGFRARLSGLARPQIVVCGIEAHVCVLQTVLDLCAAGRRVSVVRDGCGSRKPDNAAAGIERMARHGADIVTSEMVVFEWLGRADAPPFREVSKLIK
ncbi:MAG: isochorismatase family protein [Alphaproteobacteria bacterium]|jgi:nicotinamidase-related amidase|nr:isochorismatase family protein [Alphaproteobacteria bacterium]